MASPNDVGEILSMIKELAETEGIPNEVQATEELLVESLFGENSIAKVILAYIENETIGYMVYCPKFATYTGRNEIYLQDIYIKPKARGSGVALSFMVRLAKIALESKATRVEWFVLSTNRQALKFYEKLGANIIHSIKVARLEEEYLNALARVKI